jgi:beta-galactosidase
MYYGEPYTSYCELTWVKYRGQVAILFDYESEWILKTQRQGDKFSYIELIFNWYSSIRANGILSKLMFLNHLLSSSDSLVAPKKV